MSLFSKRKSPQKSSLSPYKYWLGILLAPIPILISLFIDPPQQLSQEAWSTAGLALLMATLWISEAIPISATALIPIVALPLLNISTVESATTPYANPLIFLFIGGFLVSASIQRWNLHKRISLAILLFFGIQPTRIIAGFMIITAFFSMWLSNTATVLMIFPVAISIIQIFKSIPHNTPNSIPLKHFTEALLISIAYSATIGGVGTLIGTPPNTLLAAFAKQNYNLSIGFFQWMLLGVPIVLVSLPITYVIITRIIFKIPNTPIPHIKQFLQNEIKSLGPFSYPEKMTTLVACSTGTLWTLRPLLSKFFPLINDSVIGMLCGLSLFFIPSKSKQSLTILSWKDIKKLPWDIILLLGGGLSLSSSIQHSGLAQYLGGLSTYFTNLPIIITVIIISLIIRLITELASNTATIATFLPIVASIAIGLSKDPLLLAIPCVITGSCAFILPVATPPNAIIFSSGKISTFQMIKTGSIVTILFLILIPLIFFSLGLHVFSIKT